MDILIIDNKTKHLQKIKKLAKSNGDNVKTIKCKNIDLINSADFDFIILSGGGKYSVMGNPKKYVKEIELIKNTKTPILGICLGFQLIVKAFNGTLETFNLGNRTRGIIEIKKKREDNIFNGIKNFKVYESHRWRIKKMPENFTILAESQDGVEIIKHKEKMIYGFQFHPEVFSNKTCGKQIFNNLREQPSTRGQPSPKGRGLSPLMRIEIRERSALEEERSDGKRTDLAKYFKEQLTGKLGSISKSTIKLFFVLCLTLSPNPLFAYNPLDIVINEIAWMGTANSANDEWIELYNNTNQDIDLNSWTLKSYDKAPQIELNGIIPANGYFLLERTDDTTILDISANQIYIGALSNNGEILELKDNNNNLIDIVDCLEGWFAGDNTAKQTMERNNSAISGDNAENWHTSIIAGGTPKSQNSVIDIEEKKVKTDLILPEVKEEIEQVIKQKVVYDSGIIINEVLPSPKGADAENEWIELFNTNNFVVDISGYKISDIEGTTKIYIFPKNTKIAKYGFLLLPRPETKITLNNTGDGLKLFYPDDKIVDEVVFGKAKSNQSYSRNDFNEWEYTENLTPNAINIFNSISIDQNINNNNSQQDDKNLATNPAIPENKNLASINTSSENLSSLNHQTKTNILNQYLTILIAITISILSATSIIFLKKHSEDY